MSAGENGGVGQKVLFEAGWNRDFFLVLFMNGGRGKSPRFHTFVSGVTREWEGGGEFKIS